MTAVYSIVIALALVLILFAVLVIGLLRSHGEILRRLDSMGAGMGDGHDHGDLLHLSSNQNKGPSASGQIMGVSLEGDPIVISPTSGSAPTLLAFLSTSCSSCTPFWESLDTGFRYFGGHQYRILLLTRGESEESPTRAQALRRGDAEVIMTDGPWEEFGVPGAPYFVLVQSGTGHILGEGSASNFKALEEFLVDASNDQTWDLEQANPNKADAAREERVDTDLMRAGMDPGDPRLYPDKGDLPEEREE